jgi:UDP:flavonoid glycosyltransferase YjiC (YdhE family)
MRILFLPMPVASHYYSMVPMLWACRTAGHEVRVAAEAPVSDAVMRSGMTGVLVGGGYDFAAGIAERRRERQRSGNRFGVDEVAALSPLQRREIKERRFIPQVKAAEAIVDDLVELAGEWRPQLVVADPLALAGPLVAASCGATLVRHLWGPDVIRTTGFPGMGLSEDQWPEPLLRLYERFGVGVRPEYAVRTIDTCPQSLQVKNIPGRLPVRFVPYNGPGIAPGWAGRAERPRILVTWGMSTTMMTGSSGFLIPRILESLAGFDAEIVVAVKASDRELLGVLPPRTRVVEEVPLHLLLPSCSAIVHQGGGGTVLTAASLGVPQLVVTNSGDQVFNARLLTATGAGVSLPAEKADVTALEDAVSRLLDDAGIDAAARALRDEILAQPTPAETVRTLETLV